MRVSVVLVALTFLATVVVGCDDGVPSSESAPSVQTQQEAAAPERKPRRPQERAAASRVEEPTAEVQQGTASENASEAEADDPEPERRAEQADEAASADEAEEPEPEVKVPHRDLTDVPAMVVADADMRVRPGLPWRVVRRLAAGDEVMVLSRTAGWLRIRVDDCESWIRSTALDLGEVDEYRILEQPAPPIIAEWKGVEYGVMGQSADGAEIRLLGDSDEVVSAPKGEVTLLASDITLDDLPVLIGDETVVFPGDDFRAGQGKILPKADEWMWLPWGWLLAHNDEHIWQWRPETDELEFIARSPGPAKLSPNGRHLAIVTLCDNDTDGCRRAKDVTLLPLDGELPRSFKTGIAEAAGTPEIELLLPDSPNDLHWSALGDALMIYVVPAERTSWWLPVLVLDAAGRVTYLTANVTSPHLGEDCHLQELTDDHGDPWWMRPDNTVAAFAICQSEDGSYEYVDIVFSLQGEFLQTQPSTHWTPHDLGVELIRSSEGGEGLGEDVAVQWSTTGRSAFVVGHETATLSIYSAANHRTRPVSVISPNPPTDADWPAWPQPASLGYWQSLIWNVYWYEDRTAAVMPRFGNDWITAGLLLNLATAEAVPFYDGRQSTWGWPCQRTGLWNSDGTLFHTIVRAYNDAATVAGDLGVFQSLFVGRDGEIDAALIFTRTYGYEGTPVRSEWSPSGEWIAVGGHQRLSECFSSP